MKAKDEIQRLVRKLESGDINPEEPLFCIRARDVDSAAAVIIWCVLATQSGAALEKVRGAQRTAEAMQDWPIKQVAGCPSTRIHVDP